MSELITEYFTCKICHENYPISFEEVKDKPTTCNSCWLKMEMWQRYEDPVFEETSGKMEILE